MLIAAIAAALLALAVRPELGVCLAALIAAYLISPWALVILYVGLIYALFQAPEGPGAAIAALMSLIAIVAVGLFIRKEWESIIGNPYFQPAIIGLGIASLWYVLGTERMLKLLACALTVVVVVSAMPFFLIGIFLLVRAIIGNRNGKNS